MAVHIGLCVLPILYKTMQKHLPVRNNLQLRANLQPSPFPSLQSADTGRRAWMIIYHKCQYDNDMKMKNMVMILIFRGDDC